MHSVQDYTSSPSTACRKAACRPLQISNPAQQPISIYVGKMTENIADKTPRTFSCCIVGPDLPRKATKPRRSPPAPPHARVKSFLINLISSRTGSVLENGKPTGADSASTGSTYTYPIVINRRRTWQMERLPPPICKPTACGQEEMESIRC